MRSYAASSWQKRPIAPEPAINAAMARDMETLQSRSRPKTCVQWDICYEIVGADGGPPIPYDDHLAGTATRVAALCGLVKDGVECGIHLCYGDPGHQHIVEPESLATSVAFANAICAASPRQIDFLHMPVRGRADDDTSSHGGPNLPAETRLILGLVHHTDGTDGGQADGNRGSLRTNIRYCDRVRIWAARSGDHPGPVENPPRSLRINNDINSAFLETP